MVRAYGRFLPMFINGIENFYFIEKKYFYLDSFCLLLRRDTKLWSPIVRLIGMNFVVQQLFRSTSSSKMS